MMRLLFEDLPLEKGNEVNVLVNSLGATPLEMAGFSITLFKLNEKYKEYLDHPVWTPFVKEG